MADKTLTCKDCHADFQFTESEQAFYKEKGFENEPQRCPDCRAAKKQQRGDNGGGYSSQSGQNRGGYGSYQSGNNRGGYGNEQREMFPAVCAECGRQTNVPFKPTGDRPVYCKDCYQPKGR